MLHGSYSQLSSSIEEPAVKKMLCLVIGYVLKSLPWLGIKPGLFWYEFYVRTTTPCSGGFISANAKKMPRSQVKT